MCNYSLLAGAESYSVGGRKYKIFIPEDCNPNKHMFKIMFYSF
jgi:hypothetical protein